MKPEPLKGESNFTECVGCKKECEIIRCPLYNKKGYWYRDFNIKSAVEFREQLFRKKIAERIVKILFDDGEKPGITEIMDISREVDKIAFEDVIKNDD